MGAWGEGGSKYHNPDPLCRLIGPRNKVKVIVNDKQVTALVDSGDTDICSLYDLCGVPWTAYLATATIAGL